MTGTYDPDDGPPSEYGPPVVAEILVDLLEDGSIGHEGVRYIPDFGGSK